MLVMSDVNACWVESFDLRIYTMLTNIVSFVYTPTFTNTTWYIIIKKIYIKFKYILQS